MTKSIIILSSYMRRCITTILWGQRMYKFIFLLLGVYVKVALVHIGKVISKNKTKVTQPVSTSPAFDESFIFNMPKTIIDQSCLVVAVCGKTTSGKRTHVGYVTLGPPFFATGSGLEQWTKMISIPYTSVGKWHALNVWSKKESSHHLANECNMF